MSFRALPISHTEDTTHTHKKETPAVSMAAVSLLSATSDVVARDDERAPRTAPKTNGRRRRELR